VLLEHHEEALVGLGSAIAIVPSHLSPLLPAEEDLELLADGREVAQRLHEQREGRLPSATSDTK
jgi:hypothetical protein